MYISAYEAQVLHEERLRDAERRRAHNALIRDAYEQSPVVVYNSLWQQIKQRMGVKSQQPRQQGAIDVRRATAV